MIIIYYISRLVKAYLSIKNTPEVGALSKYI